MGCRYEWADENHLIVNVYIEAPWTWQEYDNLTTEMLPILQSLKKPCATAVDVTHMGALPKGNVLMHMTRAENMLPENVFASAVVGAPYAVMVFMEILMRIRPRARRIALFTRTLPEAHERIQAAYAKIAASEQP